MNAILLAAGLAQTLAGVVFLDRNGNGVRDRDEPGVANVAVSDQDTVVLTRGDGTYRLPGARAPGLVFISVPDRYRSVRSFWRSNEGDASFPLAPRQQPDGFTFIHASDTHISAQSVPRMRRLRALADSLQPDFVIVTGDLVRDALRVGEAEAREYYRLFAQERAAFQQPMFTVPGNHEIFGIETARSGVSPSHPLFGKLMYRSMLGPDYYSFNYGGVHFVALNTADVRGEDYYGHVDSLQLAWLERDLAAIPSTMPVVTFNHIPFFSTSEVMHGYEPGPPAPTLITVGGKSLFRHTVSNSAEALAVLARRRHLLALGGHVHMRELIQYEWQGGPRRFENAAAVVAPTKFSIHQFPSGITFYRVSNGIIDAGTFVRLDPP